MLTPASKMHAKIHPYGGEYMPKFQTLNERNGNPETQSKREKIERLSRL